MTRSNFYLRFPKLKIIFNYFFALPVAALIYCLMPIIKIRLVAIFSQNIGHHVQNTELMLCALDVGMLSYFEKGRRIHYLFYNNISVSNQCLNTMWKRVLTILPGVKYWACVDNLLIRVSNNYRNDQLKRTVEPNYWGQDTHSLLRQVPTPHLAFTDIENSEGSRLLQQLGVPVGAKFVCLLVRDSAYLPGGTWRNADIKNYVSSALYLAQCGYYVLRMGTLVERLFKVNTPQVIDYANHTLRSDFLDIYLSANCSFFMSTGSGLDWVAAVFRRPIFSTNYALTKDIVFWYPNYLMIYKHLRSRSTKKELNIDERCQLLSEGIGGEWFDYSKRQCDGKLLQKYNLELVENTADELLEATKEMVARMSGHWVEKEEDKKQQTLFWTVLKSKFLDSAPLDVQLKIASVFLKSQLKIKAHKEKYPL